MGKAEVVNSEDNNWMEVSVETSDIGRKNRDGLGDGNELSRLCLGCVCHTGQGIILLSHATTKIGLRDFTDSLG